MAKQGNISRTGLTGPDSGVSASAAIPATSVHSPFPVPSVFRGGSGGRAEPVQTTCPYCGVGCGVLAHGGEQAVTGDPKHPANGGRLCVKGASLQETTGLRGRLLHPMVLGRRVRWERAIDEVAGAIGNAVAKYGAESVAFYLSGQLLTEDYYVANKLAKGFIGTPHVDTNSRLCMSSAVAAHKRAFGEDLVPGCYEDLELAELLVLTGSNTAWNHPVLYQRIKAAARAGRRMVVIDPRKTATSELADLHLALRPGTDTVLFNGLLVWLADTGQLDPAYISQHCEGFAETLASAREVAFAPQKVADICDLPEADVVEFYRWFADTSRTVTAFSQGVNQSLAGTDKCNAIINCHLATGRIGRPGACPLSLTGQPNAMGGREVGGLANTLAAHMDYDTPDATEQIAGFWGRPSATFLAKGPGLKAVDLFEAVRDGRIRVLWIIGTNPAVSLPDTPAVREALAHCPVVIVSDCVANTDTTAYADILLPALAWGEKDGTVTNSERCISRQRNFLPVPGDARPDWWILSQVGKQLGYGEAFGYETSAEVFREHASLSALNTGKRLFDITGLSGLSDQAYDQLQPIQWPVNSQCPEGTARLFGNGGYPTPGGRARLVPVPWRPPGQQPDCDWPLVVNSGRVRDQWHTMTRTGSAPRLFQHRQEPFIEAHPQDLADHDLTEGDLACLRGPKGRYLGRVRPAPAQRRGEVFVPIHWNRQFSGEGLASSLMAPVTDPLSGQPESKHGCVRLEPFPALWHARLLRPATVDRHWQADYWSRVPMADCDSWWLAGVVAVDWPREIVDWLGGAPDLVMSDPASGRYRAARLVAGRLDAILLVERSVQALPDVSWLASLFGHPELNGAQRRALLSAKDVNVEDIGAVVCSCYQVGELQIAAAIDGGATSVDALGASLQCGTNCGSCLPELKAFLERTLAPA